MRLSHLTAALAVAVLAAWPTGAAIMPMTLEELMAITDDTVHGKVLSSRTVVMDRPYEGAIHTELVIEGTSLRTGEELKQTVVFFGSHTEGARGFMSEQPDVADVRVGGESVFFLDEEELPLPHVRLHHWGAVFRVQHFGEGVEPVVMGKGQGMAFTDNLKLADAREQVRATHVKLQAEAAAQQTPGLK